MITLYKENARSKAVVNTLSIPQASKPLHEVVTNGHALSFQSFSYNADQFTKLMSDFPVDGMHGQTTHPIEQ